MAKLGKDFKRRRIVKAVSWPRIQALSDRIQIPLHIGGQVRALEQTLLQAPIHILIGTALPWAMRIDKEHVEALGPVRLSM